MPELLETTDLRDVEVLKVGGPYHGKLSPSTGDYFTSAQLHELADAARELSGELRIPAKIGHGAGQPACGELSNVRVDGDRLLTDIRRVPKRLAELIRAGAYSSRSLELSKIVSQRTGRTYSSAISGLAFLGAQLPAVHGLADVADFGDVLAMYEGESTLRRVYVVHADGDGSADALLDFSISSGRISEEERPAWARAFAQDHDTAIRELAQLPSDTAVTDEQYAREFEARGGGPVLFDHKPAASVDPDPEADEITSRLNLDPSWRVL